MENKYLTVFYDGLCKVCSAEINHYKTKDRQKKVQWIDISNPSFQAQDYNLDPKKIHIEMHAIKSDGTLAIGVDAFLEIWKVIPGFLWLNKLGSTSLTKSVLKVGYTFFVKVRPWLPRYKQFQCDDHHCAVKM